MLHTKFTAATPALTGAAYLATRIPSDKRIARHIAEHGGNRDSAIPAIQAHQADRFERFKAGEFRGADAYGSSRMQPIEMSGAQLAATAVNLPRRMDEIAAERAARAAESGL